MAPEYVYVTFPSNMVVWVGFRQLIVLSDYLVRISKQ